VNQDEIKELFHDENSHLETIVRAHFKKLGDRNINDCSRKFAQKRKRELSILRQELELQNTLNYERAEKNFQVELEREKEMIREQWSQVPTELFQKKFEVKREHELTELRNQLEKLHVQRLDRLSEDLLMEHESKLHSLKISISQQYTLKEAKMADELDQALREGARIARQMKVDELDLELRRALEELECAWDDKKLEDIRQLEMEFNTKLEHDKYKLESILNKRKHKKATECMQELAKRNSAQVAEFELEKEKELEVAMEHLKDTFNIELKNSIARIQSEHHSKLRLAISEQEKEFVSVKSTILQEKGVYFNQLLDKVKQEFEKLAHLESEQDIEDGLELWKIESSQKSIQKFLLDILDDHNELIVEMNQCQSKIASLIKELLCARKQLQLCDHESILKLSSENAILKEANFKLLNSNSYLKSTR